MALFRKKRGRTPPVKPVVWVERDDEVLRLHFTEDLQLDSEGSRELREKISRAIPGAIKVHQPAIRMYRNYLAVDMRFAPQSDEDVMDIFERLDELEASTLDLLAEYFQWSRPVVVGPQMTQAERFHTAKRLGVNWTHGSCS